MGKFKNFFGKKQKENIMVEKPVEKVEPKCEEKLVEKAECKCEEKPAEKTGCTCGCGQEEKKMITVTIDGRSIEVECNCCRASSQSSLW